LAGVERVRKVRDVESLKAVAHPLRVRLLGALRSDGPATATELGRRFGESSGSTSYHLRQLARFGFVEEDPEQPNSRDRRWRAVHEFTSWSDSDFADDPDGRAASAAMRARQREAYLSDAETFEAERDAWSMEWLDAAGQSDLLARLTPQSVTALEAQFTALVQDYGRRDADAPDAAQVHVFLAAFPRRAGRR
jgi:DNA-binding transcriptional ArsR family regulator